MTQAPPYDASALLSSSSLLSQSYYLIRPCFLTAARPFPRGATSRLMATRPWSPSTPGVDMCLHADGCRWGRVGGRGSLWLPRARSRACTRWPIVEHHRGVWENNPETSRERQLGRPILGVLLFIAVPQRRPRRAHRSCPHHDLRRPSPRVAFNIGTGTVSSDAEFDSGNTLTAMASCSPRPHWLGSQPDPNTITASIETRRRHRSGDRMQ